ncbi:hypothetical protein GCK72_010369 [Caenorhabditis remanei]|uniref:Uncharacterized protein n=1 Tax=Caenorhabditis remanei TaxID=31234 RepID=A0A6A5H4K0_CAERE|nr:hypothetical protein GCK72_010369 [Caenorhabditis remanei]KAF1762107.1 hypothetical protein GCK72_010369 [Caenorhabditis remanei]
MPPTANSARSPAPNAQKKKAKSALPSTKTNQTPSATPIDTAKNGSNEDGKKPTITPTPDVAPDKNSRVMGMNEVAEEVKKPINTPKKKKKERKELVRKTNLISHIRPGCPRDVDIIRRRAFEDELIQFETGEFTYSTDPTRYRFRSIPPLELVIQFVFPSLLLLAIMLASVSCMIFLTKEYEVEMEFNDMSEVSFSKYDSYVIVDNIDAHLKNETILRHYNCPGLVQGPYKKLDEHEFAFLKFESRRIKNAMKALTYRWIVQTEVVMNMNFDCPPSVILELE